MISSVQSIPIVSASNETVTATSVKVCRRVYNIRVHDWWHVDFKRGTNGEANEYCAALYTSQNINESSIIVTI